MNGILERHNFQQLMMMGPRNHFSDPMQLFLEGKSHQELLTTMGITSDTHDANKMKMK